MFWFEWKFALDSSSYILICFMMAIIHNVMCSFVRSGDGVCTRHVAYKLYIWWTFGIPINTLKKKKNYIILLLLCFGYKRVCFLFHARTPTSTTMNEILLTCACTCSVLYLQIVRENKVITNKWFAIVLNIFLRV